MSDKGPQYWEDPELRRAINHYLTTTKRYVAYVANGAQAQEDQVEKWLDGVPSTPRFRQRLRDFCEKERMKLPPVVIAAPDPVVATPKPTRAPYGSKKKADPLPERKVQPNAQKIPYSPPQVTNYLDEHGSLVEPMRDGITLPMPPDFVPATPPYTAAERVVMMPTSAAVAVVGQVLDRVFDRAQTDVEADYNKFLVGQDQVEFKPEPTGGLPARFKLLEPAPHFTRTSAHLMVKKDYIYFTALLWIAMGKPDRVVFGYDPETTEFLLAPLTKDHPMAMQVTKKRRFAGSVAQAVTGARLGRYLPTREEGYWVLKHE